MKIQGSTYVQSPQAIHGPQRSAAPQRSGEASSLAETDQLDISPAAELASRAIETGNLRSDRVAALRAAIEAGTYESDEKLSIALDRLMDDMG